MNRTHLIMFILLLSTSTALALPVTGRYIPEFKDIDDLVLDYMDDGGFRSCVVAIAKDGCVLYQRGFGHAYDGVTPLPEITPMRIGSITKIMVDLAIEQLAVDGYFGPEGTDRKAFNVCGNGGLLNLAPFPSIADCRIADITIRHLLDHTAGWDTLEYRGWEVDIAAEMGIPSPAGTEDRIRWMLGKPLKYDPGTLACMDKDGNPTSCYSNFGFECLGVIISTVSGQHQPYYIRDAVLTPDMWVPSTDLFHARPFRSQQSPREPRYHSDNLCTNVFAPAGGDVPCPYGGYELGIDSGAGNMVASASVLVRLMNEYFAGMGFSFAGGFDGTSSFIVNRTDGISIVVLFSESEPAAISGDLALGIDDYITSVAPSFNWPTFCVDGFWVDFNAGSFGTGGHTDPFPDMYTAQILTTSGTKLRFFPGTSNWTGVVTEKMRFDAPFGTVRIGQQ